ncbi:MAG TPA: TIGR00341 family protein [Patescibacteria group bacterium]|nr:TIGR00341 family protein [Patescibacteria group bacterium]
MDIRRKLFKNFFIAKKRQQKVYGEIQESAQPDFDFYVMSVLAGIIVILGIIIDSPAVVIGGMLLAPLVWPILAAAIGIAMGRSRMLRKALFTIMKSTLLIMLAAILIGLIIPDLLIESNEFLSRTSPTLFELLIGLAAGFVGAFIIAYPKMGEAIAGVVIAAAIVPPIATTGLSLARGDFDLAAGAFLLYLSNLIAITFAATILFLISNFNPSSETGEEQRKSGFAWTTLFLIVIIIPLLLITRQTAQELEQTRIIKNTVTSSLENVAISEVKLDDQQDILVISLTIRSKKNITEDQTAAMENVLVKRLEKPIILKIKLVPVVEAGSDLLEKWQTVKSVQEQEGSASKSQEEDRPDMVHCPVEINGQKTTRLYPASIGCPICPKIISCGDGREFPAQRYNQKTKECEDIMMEGASPCFTDYDQISSDTEEQTKEKVDETETPEEDQTITDEVNNQ